MQQCPSSSTAVAQQTSPEALPTVVEPNVCVAAGQPLSPWEFVEAAHATARSDRRSDWQDLPLDN